MDVISFRGPLHWQIVHPNAQIPKYPVFCALPWPLYGYTCKGLARIAAESRSDDLKWSDFGQTKRINKGPTKATQHLSVNSARFAHKFSKKLNPWNHQRMRSPRPADSEESQSVRNILPRGQRAPGQRDVGSHCPTAPRSFLQLYCQMTGAPKRPVQLNAIDQLKNPWSA